MSIPLKTVVIADDDLGILKVLEATLSHLGYQVCALAQSGQEAIEKVRLHKPHLILLDFHMPEMDGIAALNQIVPLATTAVVIVTGDQDPAVARKALDLGASGYMQKPYEPRQIQSVMESAWHRFQTVSELKEKARALDEALEVRKLTEKAKGILMQQQGFSEEEAHRCLLKMSQDQGIPLKELCKSVIQVRMVLGKPSKKAANP